MIETNNFKPLTEITEGTVITLYNNYDDLYKDNSDFGIIQVNQTSKVPRLFYIRKDNKYKVCGIKSEFNKLMNSR